MLMIAKGKIYVMMAKIEQKIFETNQINVKLNAKLQITKHDI